MTGGIFPRKHPGAFYRDYPYYGDVSSWHRKRKAIFLDGASGANKTALA